MSEYIIRTMERGDLDFAAQCTAGEEWASETIREFEGFYEHDPGGCLIAERQGSPVGIAIATLYGEMGFVGEIIVKPEQRSQGLGTQLLLCARDYLLENGARSVSLDGVVKAVPLYERNGFRKVCRSLRFMGSIPGQRHADVRSMTADDLQEVFAIDQQGFQADRSFFLRRRFELYPELCNVLLEAGKIVGYAAGRRGEGWVAPGPCVVLPGSAHPEHLLETAALEAGESVIALGVLEANTVAVRLLNSYGLSERVDSPWRMVYGDLVTPGLTNLCFAVGTAAKG
jgi:ribosomal protein S18 acetylase RimI-like enzyme